MPQVTAFESAAGRLQTIGALILILGIVAGVVFVIAPAYMSVADIDAPEADERSLPLSFLFLSVIMSLAGAAFCFAAAVVAVRDRRRRSGKHPTSH